MLIFDLEKNMKLQATNSFKHKNLIFNLVGLSRKITLLSFEAIIVVLVNIL